jgi:AraC-like DNA-binding protein
MKSQRPDKTCSALPDGWRCQALLELFEHLPGVQFWVKDRAGRYLVMNRACLQDHGFTEVAEAFGQTDGELSPWHIAAQFQMDDERVLKGQSVMNRIELVGRFDHTAVWCVTDKVPLHDECGRIVGTAGVARPLGRRAEFLTTADTSMARALEYLRERVSLPVRNAELARHAGVSLRVLERRFREAFYLSPQQYLRRLRVRMACHPLVYSEQSIAEIASAHGFCDQSHFGREFRRETGMTPREYRSRFRTAEP